MSQTAITLAFEYWKAQQGATGEPVLLDEFVFANVPGLNPDIPVDRSEALPSVEQIVHRQPVTRTGVVNENGVVYSAVMGADVGDFSFNWIGLLNKASGTLAMIVHAPVQQKLKTAEWQQGNVLTRSFLMEYNGAQTETGITTPAETWQIDFTARMAGMDERQRLENADIYGAAAFFGDGWLVGKTGNQFFVTKGTGYVAGLRTSLADNQNITVTVKPVKIWLDVCWTGSLTSVWNVQSKITVAENLADYVQNGVQHYVFAVASIDVNSNITDLRPKGTLNEQQASDALKKHEQSRNHPDASTSEKGFVQLSSATDSDSEKLAATPKAVKEVNDNADKRLAKEQNGRDIPDKDSFVRNIGAARAFSGSVSIGGVPDRSWTTAEFITWLESQGAFNHPYWMCKGSWSYGDNKVITDTGCGDIQLAGAVVEVMGTRGAMTIRVTTAPAGSGVTSALFTYSNHGDDYSPGWRRDLKRSGDDITGDLSLQNLNARGVVKSAGEVQTTSPSSYRIAYGDYGTFWHQNGNDLYLMLTNHGDPYGGFNALRPYVVNLATGRVTMANGATIHGLRVEGGIALGTDNGLGGNSIVLGDNDTGFKQNGDGILDVYANSAHVFRFTSGINNSIPSLRSEGYISAKGGVYEFNGSQDVRVYSPHNPPPAQDLSPYATMSWVLQNFVQNIDLTAPAEVGFRDGWGYPRGTDGAAMYNFNMVGGSSNVGNFIVRYTRKLVNNTWYVIN